MSALAFTDVQRAAIDAPSHVCLRAGAGSGKTRVLVERVLRAMERGVRPQHIVCVTFTELAAGELRRRIGASVQERAAADPTRWAGVQRELPLMTIGTVHHLCARVARAHPGLSGAGVDFEVLDDTAERLWRRQHLSRVLSDLPADVVTAVSGEVRDAVLDALLDDPTRAAAGLQLALETATEHDLSPALERLFGQVQGRFEALRTLQGVATFADLESWALRALAHPEVQGYYGHRVAHLLVDELQDTSAAQWSILSALAGEHVVLTVVGDLQQTIYSFRGADPQVFMAAQALVRDRGGLVLDMVTSFRGDPAVVRMFNDALPHLMPGPGDARPSASAFQPLDAGRIVHLQAGPPVEVHLVLDGDAVTRPRAVSRVLVSALQARLGRPVFDRALGIVRGARWSDMAVLIRARTHLGDLERALREAGVPYALHGGRDLYRRPEVQDATVLLSVLADPTNDRALLATLRGPYGGWTDGELLKLATGRRPGESLWAALQQSPAPTAQAAVTRLQTWRDASATLSAAQVLQQADHETGAPAVHAALPDGERRAANLGRLHALLRTWAEEGRRDVRDVAAHLDELLSVDAATAEAPSPATDAVQVMTVHTSKGLEFPIVAYSGLLLPKHEPHHTVRYDRDLGLLVRGRGAPSGRWAASDARAREQRQSEHERLNYVALTRAADHLILAVAPDKSSPALQMVLDAFPAAYRQTYVASDVPPLVPLPLIEQEGRLVLPARPGPGVALPGHLPVTALTEYQRCPQAFAWRHLHGYLPLVRAWGTELETTTSRTAGRDIGTAVHLALEQGWKAATLPRRVAGLARADVEEVAGLLARLDEPVYGELRAGIWEREVPVEVDFGRVVLHGVADAVDRERGVVIDYKTDRELHPDEHRLQLAVYTKALTAREAGLVYLRHDHVHWFQGEELQRSLEEVETVIGRMVALEMAPTPLPDNCTSCAYLGVCADAVGGKESPD